MIITNPPLPKLKKKGWLEEGLGRLSFKDFVI
jgi:hypothetical protein